MKYDMEVVLAIESSCDDTSVALVGRDGNILAMETMHQFELHAKYGGIYPELASRAHAEVIDVLIDDVMDKAGCTQDNIKAIGYTRGPGLMGSLIVGYAAAQALHVAWGVPIYGINHLHGHIRSIEFSSQEENVCQYPTVLLLVSGGHTMLLYLDDRYSVLELGSTRDDSVGEVYDKVARMLGIGFPGGPAIDKLAEEGRVLYNFPRPMIDQGYTFSFSGLKSSVSRFVTDNPTANKEDIAASFVEACLDTLEKKCRLAVREYRPLSLAVVGGVAASVSLRNRMMKLVEDENITLSVPPRRLSTDNAAMIGMVTWDYMDAVERGCEVSSDINPNLNVGESIAPQSE